MSVRADIGEAGFRPASRIAAVGVSRILQIGARAAAMKREGRPVIVLGAGEPDFDTPDFVKEAAKAAIDRGDTKYTALDGTPELKQAIARKFARENGVAYGTDEIAVSAGAKQILFNAFMATLDEGDEVVIPTPCWTSYSDIVAVAGGRAVLVPCSAEAGFRLTAAQLDAAITPRTRWVLLNSPSNPSGAAYGEAGYRPLLDVLLRHPHVCLMVDDIYEHIVYDDFRFVTPAAIEPRLKERTLTVNGVSKAYAMTGWRIGFAGGPKPLIKAMAVIQSQSTSCPSSVSQAAALAALDGPQDFSRSAATASAAGATSSSPRSTPSTASPAACPKGRSTPSPTAPACSAARRPRARRSAATTMSPTTCWRKRKSPWCRARPSACRPSSASPTPPARPSSPRRCAASALPAPGFPDPEGETRGSLTCLKQKKHRGC